MSELHQNGIIADKAFRLHNFKVKRREYNESIALE